MIIVNARSAPSFGYDKHESPPNSLELLMQAINVPIDRYSYESIDALEDVVSEWSMRRNLEVDARRLRADASATGELPAIAFSVIGPEGARVPSRLRSLRRAVAARGAGGAAGISGVP